MSGSSIRPLARSRMLVVSMALNTGDLHRVDTQRTDSFIMGFHLHQCFGSALDLHLMAAWIRISISNKDPDTGGLKRAQMKEKTQPDR
jgi:hypothetical protein